MESIYFLSPHFISSSFASLDPLVFTSSQESNTMLIWSRLILHYHRDISVNDARYSNPLHPTLPNLHPFASSPLLHDPSLLSHLYTLSDLPALSPPPPVTHSHLCPSPHHLSPTPSCSVGPTKVFLLQQYLPTIPARQDQALRI